MVLLQDEHPMSAVNYKSVNLVVGLGYENLKSLRETWLKQKGGKYDE